MGLLDRFVPKKPADPALPVEPATSEALPAAIQPATASPASTSPTQPVPQVGVLARLKQAREELELKNLAGAMAVYEDVLASAGDRADVLVTISGDLGVTGHPQEIVELIAPRYDAQRHGPAAGFNLLQAYLAVRQPQPAQHVLDLLFALHRPELEERLFGFSNVIADMMLMAAEGMIAAPPSSGDAAGAEATTIDLVSISKPVWYYGLENLEGLLPPKDGKLRRIAFGQLAVLGIKDAAALMPRPEDELGRLSRGIPLWLAETLTFSANCSALAVVATLRREHYGLFTAEWTPEHLRQMAETSEGGVDYVFTGALRQQHADYELVLRLWEVKKFRERKTFTTRWTPATADEVLTQLQAQLQTFMEFAPYPAGRGLAYAASARPRDYAEALGAGLTLFLGEKQVLPASQLALPDDIAERLGAMARESERASLLALGLWARAGRLGLARPPLPAAFADTPAVAQARTMLGL